jgi:MYXO-CTERM domain-containing protein
VSVVDGDAALELENGTGLSILVPGYAGEPYLRFGAGGKVEVNVNSPAKYLNEDRYAQVDVPKTAGEKKPPKWAVVGRQGVYEWHEHRIHWMSTTAPPQVKDEGEESKVFDWTVPLQVSGKPVRAVGTLNWQPDEDSGSSSALPIIAGGVGLAAIVAALALMLRRRRRAPAPATAKPTKEAW